MLTIKAVYDGIGFKPQQPIPVSENYEVVITFVRPIEGTAVRPPFEYGCMHGKMSMAEDFDAPLDDFEEYMG